MFVDRAVAHAEDVGNIAVGFTLGNPRQYLGFARRQCLLPDAHNLVVAVLNHIEQQHGLAQATWPQVARDQRAKHREFHLRLACFKRCAKP